MKNTSQLLILFIIGSLAGCGGSGSSGGGDNTHYPPRLDAFHLVDSYGSSSEDSTDPYLSLNPYMDGGQFEVYWYADNIDDYTVELRINDAPRLSGSRLISSDYCGVDLDCDLEGIQFCEYYADFSMSCDPPAAANPGQYITYFDDMIVTLPETLYLILDLCDTQSDYCEYRTLEVLVE